MAEDHAIFPYISEPWFKKKPEGIQEDMQTLLDKALKLGATVATLIRTDKVVVDVRAGFKCRLPMCWNYGRNLMCPPHAPKPHEVKELVKSYNQAILVRKEIAPKIACTPGLLNLPPDKTARALNPFRMCEHEITSLIGRLEGEAFHMGYYLASGFGAGVCFWCGLKNLSPDGVLPLRIPCEGMETGGCSFPLRSRPSMEACGFDVYATAANANWPIYALGQRSNPDKIECVGAIGILLVY